MRYVFMFDNNGNLYGDDNDLISKRHDIKFYSYDINLNNYVINILFDNPEIEIAIRDPKKEFNNILVYLSIEPQVGETFILRTAYKIEIALTFCDNYFSLEVEDENSI